MSEAKALPPGVRDWAERRIGAVAAVRDASHPRENSRIWELARHDGRRFYLKISPKARMYERETFALRHAAPAMGAGGAPQLRASNAEHLVLLVTAVPGRPVKPSRSPTPRSTRPTAKAVYSWPDCTQPAN
ncbi:hypothetical protein AB0M39_21700 [Streptomyces sp. NPDC051907]|uniref:hypothetical protein n=1 Tax=Streptomyces sp. NPDC051907 TaxID=3155284 RepID=UPI0034442CCE